MSLTRARLGIALALMLLVFLSAPAEAAYYPYRAAEGVYEIRLSRTAPQPLWLSLPGSSIALGSRVVLNDDRASFVSRRWRVQEVNLHQPNALFGGAIVRAYRLINLNSQKCMDIKGPDQRNYIAVHQWACKNVGSTTSSPAASQAWKLTRDPHGQHQLINTYSGKCLDVPEFRAFPGRLMQQWSCSEAWNQAFRLAKVG